MIRKVVLRRFKRFDEVEFEFPGHVVLAGPNNTGKTTALQAVAAWDLALRRWRQLNDFMKHGGAYTKAPIARQAFTAVPLRAFDLLWHDRRHEQSIEVEIASDQGWTLPMEIISDTSEQVFVRPRKEVPTDAARSAAVNAVFVPPMTGLATEEPLYANPEFVSLRLSQARPGDVLRNILCEASRSGEVWEALTSAIHRLFGYQLFPPDPAGAYILAEYAARPGGPRFDLASAGSGFQQVLMLLAFLNTRPGSVLLLDEPDAHLHVILQDAIYSELRAAAAAKKSQLVIATHSEVIINSVEPRELIVVLDRPRPLATTEERSRLIRSLEVLSNEDVALATQAPGVLYLEDYTDLEILRAWARILEHPSLELLTTRLFWRKTVSQPRAGAAGIPARDHYGALQLVRDDLPGLELLDGDARPEIPETPITGKGLQRLRWKRYEIESYLVHPGSLERFVEVQLGPGEHSRLGREALRTAMEKLLRADFLKEPLNPEPLVENYLRTTKARTTILPPLLDAAGLPAFPHTRYHEIAAAMKPEEIHPEVREKLAGIRQAFRS